MIYHRHALVKATCIDICEVIMRKIKYHVLKSIGCVKDKFAIEGEG